MALTLILIILSIFILIFFLWIYYKYRQEQRGELDETTISGRFFMRAKDCCSRWGWGKNGEF